MNSDDVGVAQDVLVLGKFLDERLQALRQRHQA